MKTVDLHYCSVALQILNVLKLEETRECFDAAGFHILIIKDKIPELTASYSVPLQHRC